MNQEAMRLVVRCGIGVLAVSLLMPAASRAVQRLGGSPRAQLFWGSGVPFALAIAAPQLVSEWLGWAPESRPTDLLWTGAVTTAVLWWLPLPAPLREVPAPPPARWPSDDPSA